MAWSAVLLKERQDQQKRHHRHFDFYSNDWQVPTRKIRSTDCICKRELAESNTCNGSTRRILPTLNSAMSQLFQQFR